MGVVDAIEFRQDFDSIQLKTLMQRLAVFTYIKLLQRAAIICYCSAPLKVVPIEGVMQSVVFYLFLDIVYHFTMHTWSSF